MAVYAAMIERIDMAMSALVDGLKRRGVLDNTAILFLSDNGGNAEGEPPGVTRRDGAIGGPQSYALLGMDWATVANTPFRRYKHFTHEGGISTPLIAQWPAGIPEGRRGALEKQPVHLIDVMATAVDLAGTLYPREFGGNAIEPMQGVSLRPALLGKPLTRTEPIFWEHEGNKAVRDGKWKLVLRDETHTAQLPVHFVGPMTKIVLPKGSITSNVRIPHGSFLGGWRISTWVRHSS